ncbi:alpha/beta hydrolase [Mycoavidus sp. B2-EB]|uniref:alpha/beta hydrolase n=1 Tax=Mycoavidus sp. B2-EB TaxID=2651972 RepID=UPI001626B9AE|nr:alpha/beta hydrolase [Mycoavidus sp. B2-EB]BBO60512.1 hypothetical protein MPB2EB_1656 [Mycoavidus sp. B2-EB]
MADPKKYLIDGPIGKIEIAIDWPPESEAQNVPARGIALIAHPHPLLGGTMDNKVAHTLARTLMQLGYVAVRSNFRGVGRTEGEHDHGLGEQDDLLAVLEHIRTQPLCADGPLVLAGFSFGTFVLSHLAQRLAQTNTQVQRLVFVGTAAGRWAVAPVPEDTIVIHGEQDDTIPLTAVFDWARPQELPVTIIPGADHFFHRKLHLLKRIIVESWRV